MVGDWLGAFVRQHSARHPAARLPEFDSESGQLVYRVWEREFEALGLDMAQATRASERMLVDPPPRMAEHFKTLLRYSQDAAGGVSGRDAAMAASKDCQFCGGEGLATVYRPAREDCRDIPDERYARIPPQIAAWCVCPMGRWIRACHVRRDSNASDLYRDLADVLSKRLRWVVAGAVPTDVQLFDWSQGRDRVLRNIGGRVLAEENPF